MLLPPTSHTQRDRQRNGLTKIAATTCSCWHTSRDAAVVADGRTERRNAVGHGRSTRCTTAPPTPHRCVGWRQRQRCWFVVVGSTGHDDDDAIMMPTFSGRHNQLSQLQPHWQPKHLKSRCVNLLSAVLLARRRRTMASDDVDDDDESGGGYVRGQTQRRSADVQCY